MVILIILKKPGMQDCLAAQHLFGFCDTRLCNHMQKATGAPAHWGYDGKHINQIREKAKKHNARHPRN